MIDLEKLVGLTEEDAVAKVKTAGFLSRVRSRNGENFVVTMEYRTNRVNLWVENNLVSKANIG